MSKTTIYVVAHKEAPIPQKTIYKSLLVGANLGNKFDGADYKDNEGKNISEKNRSYCELTGIYWIWKNDNTSDIIGISHYRRYFSNNYLSMSLDSCVDEKTINKIFERYDIIVSKPAIFSDTVVNSLRVAPNYNDMKALENAIKVVCPEYSKEYNFFLNGNQYYPYNMFVMKRNDFKKYCEWLFSILDYVEKEYGNPYTDDYRIRLFGFLSERLLYVWVKHNFDSKKVKKLKVLYTEESLFRSNIHIISGIIHNLRFIIKR